MAVQHDPKGSWTNTGNIGHISHKMSDCPGVHIPSLDKMQHPKVASKAEWQRKAQI